MNNDKLKRLFKKFLFFLVFSILLWFFKLVCVNAETFDNTNYMRWTLTDSSGTTMNSGQTPFYTNYLNKDYPNARLYFHYTNYTFYSDYFYDITYTYYFDNKTNYHDHVYAMFVSSCHIYIEGIGDGNQFSDGCEILEKDATHLKIRSRNLKINGSGPVSLQLFSQNDNILGSTDIMHVQMNSYLLEINAKKDTSISSSQFEDSIKDITTKQNETNQKLDNINSSLTDSSPISLDKLNDTTGWLPSGPVDSILNLPLSLLNNLSTNLNKQCTPLSLNIPFLDKSNTLVLPCLANTLSENVEGFDTFYSWLGLVVSCLLLYRYLMSLYVWVDNVLMLRLEMYEDFGGKPTNFGSV